MSFSSHPPRGASSRRTRHAGFVARPWRTYNFAIIPSNDANASRKRHPPVGCPVRQPGNLSVAGDQKLAESDVPTRHAHSRGGSLSKLSRSGPPFAHHHRRKLRLVVDAQLRVDALQMVAHRRRRQFEHARDLLVRTTGSVERSDANLTRRQFGNRTPRAGADEQELADALDDETDRAARPVRAANTGRALKDTGGQPCARPLRPLQAHPL